jgi:hypothetical protein
MRHNSDFDPSKITTQVIKRKAMALITPETKVAVQLGGIITAAISLVSATIFVWTIKSNGEQALAEIRLMNERFEKMMPEHQRMWFEYETRSTAMRPSYKASTP